MLGHSESSNKGEIIAEWKGSYIIEQALGRDAYKLINSNGTKFVPLIKGKYLQAYQAPRGYKHTKAPIIYGGDTSESSVEENEEECYMVSPRSVNSKDTRSNDSSGLKPVDRTKCMKCSTENDTYAMIKCDQCLKRSSTHRILGRNIAPGCDKKFHGRLCPSCKCVKKEAQKKMKGRYRVKGRFPNPEPSISDSSRGSDGAADAQCPATDYDTDSGSSNKGDEAECQNCYMVEIKSDSHGEESELDYDSEGNLPVKKAFV